MLGAGAAYSTHFVTHQTASEQQAIPASINALTAEISQLKAAIEALTQLIARQQVAGEQPTAPVRPRRSKRISDEAAKALIKAYFEKKHGETVYPSDIADDIGIDYERTIKLIQRLEDDGQVARI